MHEFNSLKLHNSRWSEWFCRNSSIYSHKFKLYKFLDCRSFWRFFRRYADDPKFTLKFSERIYFFGGSRLQYRICIRITVITSKFNTHLISIGLFNYYINDEWDYNCSLRLSAIFIVTSLWTVHLNLHAFLDEIHTLCCNRLITKYSYISSLRDNWYLS